jgi:hypothetical protein
LPLFFVVPGKWSPALEEARRIPIIVIFTIEIVGVTGNGLHARVGDRCRCRGAGGRIGWS